MTIIEKFDAHFESLASAATNNNVILKQLTNATTTQCTKITEFLGAISANFSNANSAAEATIIPRNTSTCSPALPRDRKYKLNRCITQIKGVV